MWRTLILTALLALGIADGVLAAPPPYLMLRTPPAPGGRKPYYRRHPGTPYDVHAQAYSYGFFGARPRRHWSHQHGYYRNYTQWSGR